MILKLFSTTNTSQPWGKKKKKGPGGWGGRAFKGREDMKMDRDWGSML